MIEMKTRNTAVRRMNGAAAVVLSVLALTAVQKLPAQDSPPAQLTALVRNAVQADANANGSNGVLFQVSTLDALLQGIYSGSVTVGELKQHGDFGLGTYEGLDGEMIVVNGHYYHMRAT